MQPNIFSNDDIISASLSLKNNSKRDLVLSTPLYSEKTPGIPGSNIQLGSKTGTHIYNGITFYSVKDEYTVTALSNIIVPVDKILTGVFVFADPEYISGVKCLDETIQDRYDTIWLYEQ